MFCLNLKRGTLILNYDALIVRENIYTANGRK